MVLLALVRPNSNEEKSLMTAELLPPTLAGPCRYAPVMEEDKLVNVRWKKHAPDDSISCTAAVPRDVAEALAMVPSSKAYPVVTLPVANCAKHDSTQYTALVKAVADAGLEGMFCCTHAFSWPLHVPEPSPCTTATKAGMQPESA